MTTFNHVRLVPYEEAKKPLLISNNGYSHYEIDGRKVTRITQILKDYENEGLIKWRDKMGAYAANLEAKRGLERGNSVHKISEAYLNNSCTCKYESEILGYGMFNALRPYLNRISNIRAIEAPVYHSGFNVAGTADIVAEFDNADGELSIIDIKSSKLPKRLDWSKKYFLQMTFYSLALESMTNITIDNIVALEVSENGVVQVLKQHRSHWVKELEAIIANYKQLHGVSL
tara:strand:- start:2208 stop:2897 length:690 start_codon:yes stop_codon:yes gene_type:complete